MRLLLDEHLSPRIAEGLRVIGHDVTTVVESGMAGVADRMLVARARDEGRAIVTINVSDYAGIAIELEHVGAHHAGLILASRRRFPASRNGIGLLIAALDALLVQHPGSEALVDRTIWLEPKRPAT